jgi:hypothetical protein
MLRQIASMAAFAIVASPLLPLAQSPAVATPHKPGHEKQCVQVKLDRYDYRGQVQDGGHYWDKLYFDWHVDCYNQDKPPYEVYVTAYYGDKYYSETYRGNLSDYTFKVRKPNAYAGKKPTYVKIIIKVVGNQGTYEYKNNRIVF